MPYFSMYIQVMIVGVIGTCKIWRKWGWGFLAPPFIQTFISSYTPILFHSSFIIPYRFSYYNTPYRIGSPYSYSYRSNHYYYFLYHMGSPYSHSLQTHFILSHVQMQYKPYTIKKTFSFGSFLNSKSKKKKLNYPIFELPNPIRKSKKAGKPISTRVSAILTSKNNIKSCKNMPIFGLSYCRIYKLSYFLFNPP